MRQIVRRLGRFALVRSEAGFAWTMPGPEGLPWYWHPDKAHWTGRPCSSPTAVRASVGFDADATKPSGRRAGRSP